MPFDTWNNKKAKHEKEISDKEIMLLFQK